MHVPRETVGTFIDAVYAIAVTILALEIPADAFQSADQLASFANVLLEYGVTFFLLFTLWLQHRRINGLVEFVNRSGVWTNATILMLVCLVPRATTLVFEFGDDVTISALDSSILGSTGWTTAELVDLFYVAIVVSVDLGILALLRLQHAEAREPQRSVLRRSKVITSTLLVLVVATSFVLPVENRYFLLVIPIVLFFEDELSRVFSR